MPDTIQLSEHLGGSGTGGIMHITDSDGNPKLFNVERNDDGKRWLNSNWGNADNEWNPEHVFLVAVPRNSRSFLSRSACGRFGRVLFSELSLPATKHAARFVERRREGYILLGINGMRFPQHHEQNFESIECSN